jgi:hypothetical protein
MLKRGFRSGKEIRSHHWVIDHPHLFPRKSSTVNEVLGHSL